MIALTGFLLIALIAMLLAPDTPFGRLCHCELVERPVAALRRFRTHHLIYAVILLPILFTGGEFIALLGPEFFAAYALELAIYFDAVAFTLVASALAQARGAWRQVRLVTRRVLPRARRRRRARLARPERIASNDDDPPDARLAA